MDPRNYIAIDEDQMFDFVGSLPVTRSFYKGQFVLHPMESDKHTVLRFAGKEYVPIASILMKNEDGVKEACTYAKSRNDVSEKPFLALFAAGNAKGVDYATLNCACLFMFGAIERSKFPLRMFSTPALQAAYAMPSLSFVREMSKCQPTLLHSSVWVSEEISPFVTSLLRFLKMFSFG